MLGYKAFARSDEEGFIDRVHTTSANKGESPEFGTMIRGARARRVLADKAYDSNEILDLAQRQGMKAVIPPKRNRKEQREYDKDLYKLRHLVENAFLHLKRWRSVATRYAKNAKSFLAIVQIRCIALWAKIS